VTRLIALSLSLAYTGLGYGLIAWKYQNFSRLGPGGRRGLVALHLWFVLSNVTLFAGWVIHDYRPASWHPFPLARFGLFVAGAALVVWALAHIRSAAFVSSAKRPLTEGPYAWVRHPVYLGGILGAFGLAYAAGSPWIFSYAAVIAMLLHWVSQSEERELIRRYGEAYRVYALGTRRFLPIRKPVTRTGRSLAPEEDCQR
jgi:protein-S-isoprenylcysteine O-methyltransferase Ste14